MGKKTSRNKRSVQTPDKQAETQATGVASAQHQNNLLDHFIFWATLIILSTVPLVWSYKTFRTFDTSKASYLKFFLSIIIMLWTCRLMFIRDLQSLFASSKVMAIPVLLYGLVYLVSTVFSTDPWMSLVGIYYKQIGLTGYVAMILGYFILTTLRPQKMHVGWLFLPLVVTDVLVALHGFAQVFGFYPLGLPKVEVHEGIPRLTSFPGNPNITGDLLVVIIPIVALLREKFFPHAAKFLTGAVMALLIAAVFITLTRGAMIALFLSFGFWLFLFLNSNEYRGQRVFEKRILLMLMVLATQTSFSMLILANPSKPIPILIGMLLHIGLVFLVWKWREFPQFKSTHALIAAFITVFISLGIAAFFCFYFVENFHVPVIHRFINMFRVESSIRIQVWKQTMKLIADHPIVGIGPETFRQIFSTYNVPELEIMTPNINFDNPHNNYLYYWATLGPLGLAAFIYMLWKPVSTGLRHLKKSEFLQHAKATRMLLAAFMAFAFWNLPGFESMSTVPQLYLCLVGAAWIFADFEKPTALRWPNWSIKLILLALIPFHLWNAYDAAQRYRADSSLAYGYRNMRTLTKDEMVEYHKKAHEIYPSESFYLLKWGDALFTRGKFHPIKSTTAQYFREADELATRAFNHAWAPENVCLLKIKIAVTSRNIAKAQTWIAKALEYSPNTTFLVELDGRFKRAMNKTLQAPQPPQPLAPPQR